MESKGQPTSKSRFRLLNFGGKNRRFYASALTMLLLVLAPLGLYATLSRGNDLLAGVFFAVLAGSMLAMLVLG